MTRPVPRPRQDRSRPSRGLPRPVAAAGVVTGAVWMALVAPTLLSAASANTPLGWSDPAKVDPLHAVLVLVCIPLALFLVITALVMGPGWVSHERTAKTGGGELETWFGGPQRGSKSIEASGATTSDERGGAGGRW